MHDFHLALNNNSKQQQLTLAVAATSTLPHHSSHITTTDHYQQSNIFIRFSYHIQYQVAKAQIISIIIQSCHGNTRTAERTSISATLLFIYHYHSYQSSPHISYPIVCIISYDIDTHNADTIQHICTNNHNHGIIAQIIK